MELDQFLNKIQGLLQNEQRLSGALTSLTKEKEEAINKIVSAFKVILAGENDIKSSQKLYILLFLNTDTSIYNDLKKNRNIVHLVGFFPKISKDLFMRLVIDLQLQQFLYESVTLFSTSLSYQVLDMCINALTWLDLFEAVDFVEKILTFLFNKIVRIEESDKFNIHLKDLFHRLLLHYDSEKGGSIKRMRLWKTPKLKHYGGLVMASLLSLLNECTKIYCKKEYDFVSNNKELYNVNVDQDTVYFEVKADTEIQPCTVQQCYEQVMSRCYENVCSITVDIWLFWVEIDLDDIPDTENTLQRLVGEKAYICRETLQEAESAGITSSFASDMINKTANLAIKPYKEEDHVDSLNLEQVLLNIQDPNKDSKKWLRFLINNELFVVEPSSLKVIEDNIAHLHNSYLFKLINPLFRFIKTTNNCTKQKNFILYLSRQLDNDSVIEFSKLFVDYFGITETFKTEDFQPAYIEVFNKVINEEDKEKELYPQFLWLAVQDAKTVVSRAVKEGITSEVRGHLMADILDKLQVFCDARDKQNGDRPLLIDALGNLLTELESLPENHRTNYPLFVREMVMRKNLNGLEFIKTCLMEKLHQNLQHKNWVILKACLDSLSELFDIDCVCHYGSGAVMLLQVVEACRWTVTSFSMSAVRVCDTALQLVDQYITRWMTMGHEVKHAMNLAELVRKRISCMNRYHLFRIMPDEPLPSDPAQLLLYRMHYGIGEWSVLHVTSEERTKLVYSLCYVIPVLTPQEWQDLFCVVTPKCSEFLWLFHVMTDSLLVCLDSAKITQTPQVMSCLGFTLINIAQSVKYEAKRWTKDDNEYRISVLSKICQVVAAFPQSHQEDFSLVLVGVLQKLLPEGSRRRPLSDEEMNRVTTAIALIATASVRQCIAKEFLEMVHR